MFRMGLRFGRCWFFREMKNKRCVTYCFGKASGALAVLLLFGGCATFYADLNFFEVSSDCWCCCECKYLR